MWLENLFANAWLLLLAIAFPGLAQDRTKRKEVLGAFGHYEKIF